MYMLSPLHKVSYPQPSKGMLALLDEECLRPGEVGMLSFLSGLGIFLQSLPPSLPLPLQPTDETFLQKLDQHCANSHAHYESRAVKELLSDQTLDRHQFRLVHYAGKVAINVFDRTLAGLLLIREANCHVHMRCMCCR